MRVRGLAGELRDRLAVRLLDHGHDHSLVEVDGKPQVDIGRQLDCVLGHARVESRVRAQLDGHGAQHQVGR